MLRRAIYAHRPSETGTVGEGDGAMQRLVSNGPLVERLDTVDIATSELHVDLSLWVFQRRRDLAPARANGGPLRLPR